MKKLGHTMYDPTTIEAGLGKTVVPAANYMDLKLHIGIYCGLFWTIFGDHCNYYKELLKFYRILVQEEYFNIRHTYTKEVCASIMRAILDEGRSFFGQNPMASDFAVGTSFNFLVSYHEGVTDAIHNANPIQWATFSRKWLFLSIADSPYSVPPAGPPPTHWGNPAPALAPALAPAPLPCPAPSLPKEDTCHPKIKLLMDP
jgi:hypothetical protein